jgi:integrase
MRARRALPDRYADGETLGFHALHHSCCCFLREKGVDLGTVSVLKGHRTLAMTQRIYSRYDRIQKKGVLDALPVLDASPVSHSCQRAAEGL